MPSDAIKSKVGRLQHAAGGRGRACRAPGPRRGGAGFRRCASRRARCARLIAIVARIHATQFERHHGVGARRHHRAGHDAHALPGQHAAGDAARRPSRWPPRAARAAPRHATHCRRTRSRPLPSCRAPARRSARSHRRRARDRARERAVPSRARRSVRAAPRSPRAPAPTLRLASRAASGEGPSSLIERRLCSAAFTRRIASYAPASISPACACAPRIHGSAACCAAPDKSP